MAEDDCPEGWAAAPLIEGEDGDEAPADAAEAPSLWTLGPAPARRRVYVRYSPELVARLCERLAAGEMLYRICREADMPTPEGLAKWMKDKPDVREAVTLARDAGGRPLGQRGPASTYSEAVAGEIFERLCEGESLCAIGRDPTMPSISTIFRWRRRRADFEDAIQDGRQIQGEMFCDLGWEIARAATPETAYLTHVRLTHLRWTAGVMAPRLARLKPVEPEPRRKVKTILFRHFKVEVDPETGKRKVVAYCPNPDTMELEREDTPGWRQPGDRDTFSLPSGRRSG